MNITLAGVTAAQLTGSLPASEPIMQLLRCFGTSPIIIHIQHETLGSAGVPPAEAGVSPAESAALIPVTFHNDATLPPGAGPRRGRKVSRQAPAGAGNGRAAGHGTRMPRLAFGAGEQRDPRPATCGSPDAGSTVYRSGTLKEEVRKAAQRAAEPFTAAAIDAALPASLVHGKSSTGVSLLGLEADGLIERCGKEGAALLFRRTKKLCAAQDVSTSAEHRPHPAE